MVEGRTFSRDFPADTSNAIMINESKFSKLSIILTILAILIACLGLIGLTSFMVERKTREICVRRVHGATVSITTIYAYRASLMNPADTLKYE